jgi:hypothetical protein
LLLKDLAFIQGDSQVSINLKKTLLFCTSLVFAANGHAALISRDDAVFGPDSLTYDPQTGFEWLDVSATTPQGYSQMRAQTLTPGNNYFGFTHGSEAEINTLLRNSGAFAPTQSLTIPQGQTAADPLAATALKTLLGWVPNDVLAYTGAFNPTTFARRTLFIEEPDPATGRVRINQNQPVDSNTPYYHVLRRPGPAAPPPPPPPPPPAFINIAARLVTGSPSGIFQSVDTPSTAFELAFDTLFETTTGTLEVSLSGEILATIDAPNTLSSGFTTNSVLIEQAGLLNLTGVELGFVIDGPTGSTVLIDNIQFPGLTDGDFQSGDLNSWRIEASPNGAVGVVAVDVPAPASLLLFASGLFGLALRRRKS